MEYLQAPQARAVSYNTTDVVAAPAQQPDDGDASGQLRSINQVSLAFLENMKVSVFPRPVGKQLALPFEIQSINSHSFGLANIPTSRQRFTT